MTIKSTMVAAMTVTPMALASGAAAHPGAAHTPPARAKAYGRYCHGQSKKHVAGQRRTPYSDCVSAGAKLLAARQKAAATS